MDTPHRLGDKDLPFKRCDECGDRGHLFVIDGDVLCSDCADPDA